MSRRNRGAHVRERRDGFRPVCFRNGGAARSATGGRDRLVVDGGEDLRGGGARERGLTAQMSNLPDQFVGPIGFVFAGAAALGGVQLVARLAILGGWLPDRPNDRSSHIEITPRSGGVAIFLAWTVATAVAVAFSGFAALRHEAALFAPLAFGVFALGLADDALGVRAMHKLFGQFVVAIAFVLICGALSVAPLPFGGLTELGSLAAPVTVFWIVGFMNAFNFMDGVNGIAAACAAFALAVFAVAAAVTGAPFWSLASGLLAVTLVGFLPLNFPRARLFMGDNGSQLIGFAVAAAAVGGANQSGGAMSALFLPTAMLPFIFDVSFTLAHRAARGRNVILAHREHLYQLLLRLGFSHAAVTAVFLGLTALSTTAALLMLQLEPAWQWIAPAAVIALLAPAALHVFAVARERGLLAVAPVTGEPLEGRISEAPVEISRAAE